MSAPACGGALCFRLCSIEMIVGASSIQMKNNPHFSFKYATKGCNKYFFVVFSPNLILFFYFLKITIYSLISLFSVHSVC
jgi:hypothetical protein